MELMCQSVDMLSEKAVTGKQEERCCGVSLTHHEEKYLALYFPLHTFSCLLIAMSLYIPLLDQIYH